MLTQLHEAGWCLVDFFKPADILVIQGTTKLSAFIRDNTVYTQTERLSHREPSCEITVIIMVLCYMFAFVILNFFYKNHNDCGLYITCT